MKRRNFFKNIGLFALGSSVLSPIDAVSKPLENDYIRKNKKAKNIIFIISDGMSIGSLNLTDLYLKRKTGQGTNWLQLYKDNKVNRALMNAASASSLVADSAAAGSAWGSGVSVPNGSLNMSADGKKFLPIWQKFKKTGKKVGCVTTVPITHATPASFCVNNKTRYNQEEIAIEYLKHKFDVLLGGGDKLFSSKYRKDKKDLYSKYKNSGYQIVKNRNQMLNSEIDKSILGVFSHYDLPYSLERKQDKDLIEEVPTLSEMTKTAIDNMKNHPDGFVLQVEAGKVDWAAHGNDIAGIIHDQIAHDEAIKLAIDFAEKDKETLVIITTDHGNANPGLMYGKEANKNFDSILNYKHTNKWILNGFNETTSISQVKERINYALNFAPSNDEAKEILTYYKKIEKEDGLYNPRNLPFKYLSEIQKKNSSIGWISMDHSGDYVELAMYGTGSDLLKPYVENTDLHYLMLEAAEVENKF